MFFGIDLEITKAAVPATRLNSAVVSTDWLPASISRTEVQPAAAAASSSTGDVVSARSSSESPSPLHASTHQTASKDDQPPRFNGDVVGRHYEVNDEMPDVVNNACTGSARSGRHTPTPVPSQKSPVSGLLGIHQARLPHRRQAYGKAGIFRAPAASPSAHHEDRQQTRQRIRNIMALASVTDIIGRPDPIASDIPLSPTRSAGDPCCDSG